MPISNHVVNLNVSKWNKLFHFVILMSATLFMVCGAQARLASTFRAHNLGFVSEEFSNTQSSNFSMVGVQIKSVDSENDFLKANLGGLYAFGSPQLSYLNVRELFIHAPLSSRASVKSQFIIGRRMVDWSELDSTWNLGLYQPQFRWNPIHPTAQGLTGLFWQVKSDSWGFSMFGSPLFIPDQSASYELKDGEFKKSSPWFSSPPKNAQFGTDSVPIQYQITEPPLSDIFYQPSYGAQFEWGEKVGFFGQIASMYKPSNQIALSYKATVNPAPAVDVEVVPKSYYEHSTSFDLGFRSTESAASVSYILNRPEQVEANSDFTKPLFSKTELLGLRLSHGSSRGKMPFEVSVAHLQTSGTPVTDLGPDAIADRPALSSKYLLQNAVKLAGELKMRLTKDLRWVTEVSWTQSYSSDFRQLKSHNRFDFRGPWALTLDLFFVDSTTIGSPVYNLKDLDQLWLGVTYDF